jgi:hypothetical protein
MPLSSAHAIVPPATATAVSGPPLVLVKSVAVVPLSCTRIALLVPFTQ